MGFIYAISNSINGKLYIGQTIKTVDGRWKEHLGTAKLYREFMEGKRPQNNKTIAASTKIYKAMFKHGVQNFRVDTLIKVNDDMLDEYEIQYITDNDSVNNGYNIRLGGCGGGYVLEDIKQFRKYDVLEGLPIHCIYLKKGDTDGVAVNKHPLCNRKNFTVKKYGSMDLAKQALLLYLDELEKSGVSKPMITKRDSTLPKGINKIKNSYFVDKTYKGQTYRKSFSGLSDEENKLNAINYLNEIIQK